MIRVMYEPLRFDVLSLFPETLKGFTSESIIGRACEHALIDVQSLDLRNWAEGRHRITAGRPFGGGAGMVLKPEPIFAAVEELVPYTPVPLPTTRHVLTTAVAEE